MQQNYALILEQPGKEKEHYSSKGERLISKTKVAPGRWPACGLLRPQKRHDHS